MKPRQPSARRAWRCVFRCALAGWLAAPSLAMAVSCTVSTSGLVFGVYDPFSPSPLDSAGDIAVTCDAAVAYTVQLSAGGGSYLGRQMAGAGHGLIYNLYVDASRAAVWGDGSSASNVVAGSAGSAHHTVYGRVPARQNVYAGSYADSVTITVGY